jgi:hypothetical protein
MMMMMMMDAIVSISDVGHMLLDWNVVMTVVDRWRRGRCLE